MVLPLPALLKNLSAMPPSISVASRQNVFTMTLVGDNPATSPATLGVAISEFCPDGYATL